MVFERGIAGYKRELTYKGRRTGDKITEHSDLLAMFWLKGQRPEKYREDSKIQINLNTPPSVNIISPVIDVTPQDSQDNDTCDDKKVEIE